MAIFEEMRRLRETGTCESCHARTGNYHMFWYGTKETKDHLLSSSTKLQWGDDGAYLCPDCIMESQRSRTRTRHIIYRVCMVLLVLVAIAAPIIAGIPGLWVTGACLLVAGVLLLMVRSGSRKPSFTSGSWLAWKIKGKGYRQQGYDQWWDHRPRWFDT